MKTKAFKIVRILFLIVGLFLLGGVIQKIGWDAIKTQVIKLHWQLLPILSIGFLWYLFYTVAWRRILKEQGNKIPFWSLFRAKIVGETINTMTPANFLGGDPMRIYWLRESSQITRLAASVVVDRTINSIAIVSVIFMGSGMAFLTLPSLPFQVKLGIPIFLFASTGGIFFFLLKQHRGLFGAILQLGKRFHIATHFATKYLSKAQELDLEVLDLYQKSHIAFWEALGFHIGGRLLGILEVFLIGKAILPDFSIVIALLLATLAPVINMAFTFIPGALGVMEGAYSGVLYLLGLDPALGLIIQVVKRIRSSLWMGLGFIWILFLRNPQKAPDSVDPLRQSL